MIVCYLLGCSRGSHSMPRISTDLRGIASISSSWRGTRGLPSTGLAWKMATLRSCLARGCMLALGLCRACLSTCYGQAG